MGLLVCLVQRDTVGSSNEQGLSGAWMSRGKNWRAKSWSPLKPAEVLLLTSTNPGFLPEFCKLGFWLRRNCVVLLLLAASPRLHILSVFKLSFIRSGCVLWETKLKVYLRAPETCSDELHRETLNICLMLGHSFSRTPNHSKEIVENLFAFKFQTSSLKL